MLEDASGRVLFLERRIGNEKECRIELPCILVTDANADPVLLLSDAFRMQTGIDGEVCDITLQAKHNAGSRKKKLRVPCLVFRMKSKSSAVRPSPDFSGYRWIALRDAKKCRLSRNAEWLRVV